MNPNIILSAKNFEVTPESQAQLFELQRKKQAARREDELMGVLSQTTLGSPEQTRALSRYGKAGLDYLKGVQDLKKAEYETQRSSQELVAKSLENAKGLIPSIQNEADALNWVAGNFRDPALSSYFQGRGVTLEDSLNQAMTLLSQPGGLEKLKAISAMGMEKLLEQQFIPQDYGGGTRILAVPKNMPGGAASVVGGSNIKKTIDPNRERVFINMGDNVLDKAYMEDLVEEYKKNKDIATTLKKYEEAKAQIPKAKELMGKGGQSVTDIISFMNSRLGFNINTEGVEAAGKLEGLLIDEITKKVKQADPNASEKQFERIAKAVGSISTDPKALPFLIDTLAESEIESAKRYNEKYQSVVESGYKPKYDASIKIPSYSKEKDKSAPFATGTTQSRAKAVYDRLSPEAKAAYEKRYGKP